MAGVFVKANHKMIRGSSIDEKSMYKLLNVSLPTSNSTQTLSDDTSSNLVLLSDSIGTAACASGWTRYTGTGNCYMESPSTYTWYEAEAWCWSQRAGAHLASVHSQAESQWLAATYKVWYLAMDDWIGLRRACDNVTYYWTDGSPVDFQWWQPDYPQSAYAEESCTTIWDTVFLHLEADYVPGQFDDMKDCGSGGSSALCKYDPNSALIGEPYSPQVCTTPGPTTASVSTASTSTAPTSTTVSSTTVTPTTPSHSTPFNSALCPVSFNCPENWIQYRLKCYALFEQNATWQQASDWCGTQGASLVEITDGEENEAIRLSFSSNSPDDTAWIGKPGSYSNWAAGQETSGECAVFTLSAISTFNYSRGAWFSAPCDSAQNFAICSKAVGS